MTLQTFRNIYLARPKPLAAMFDVSLRNRSDSRAQNGRAGARQAGKTPAVNESEQGQVVPRFIGRVG